MSSTFWLEKWKLQCYSRCYIFRCHSCFFFFFLFLPFSTTLRFSICRKILQRIVWRDYVSSSVLFVCVCFFPSAVLIRVEQSGLSSFNRLHMQNISREIRVRAHNSNICRFIWRLKALNRRRGSWEGKGREERGESGTEWNWNLFTFCLFHTMDQFQMKSLEQSEHTHILFLNFQERGIIQTLTTIKADSLRDMRAHLLLYLT